MYCKTFVIKPLVINSAHRLSVKTSIFFRINCFALAAWDFLPDTNILNIEILISKMQYRIKLKVLALTKRITCNKNYKLLLEPRNCGILYVYQNRNQKNGLDSSDVRRHSEGKSFFILIKRLNNDSIVIMMLPIKIK